MRTLNSNTKSDALSWVLTAMLIAVYVGLNMLYFYSILSTREILLWLESFGLEGKVFVYSFLALMLILPVFFQISLALAAFKVLDYIWDDD